MALAVPALAAEDVAEVEPEPDVVLPVGATVGAEAVEAVFSAVAEDGVDKSRLGKSSALHRSGRLLVKVNCWSSGHALMHSICGSPVSE